MFIFYLCESYDFVFKQYPLTIGKSNSYLSLFNLMKKIISNKILKKKLLNHLIRRRAIGTNFDKCYWIWTIFPIGWNIIYILKHFKQCFLNVSCETWVYYDMFIPVDVVEKCNFNFKLVWEKTVCTLSHLTLGNPMDCSPP